MAGFFAREKLDTEIRDLERIRRPYKAGIVPSISIWEPNLTGGSAQVDKGEEELVEDFVNPRAGDLLLAHAAQEEANNQRVPWKEHLKKDPLRRLEASNLHNSLKLKAQQIATQGHVPVITKQCESAIEYNKGLLSSSNTRLLTQTLQDVIKNGVKTPFRLVGNNALALYNATECLARR